MKNRDFLSKATDDVHQSLDSRMGDIGVFESRGKYGKFLLCMAALHLHFADACRHVTQAARLPERDRDLLGCFEDDFLSLSVGETSHWKLPVGDERTEASNGVTAFDWGCCYAIEGSAVGGSFMRKAAQKKLPGDVKIAYLTQLSSDAKHRWPVFIEKLNDQTLDQDEMKRGAVAAFEFVTRQVDSRF